jgi:hypothetical protein
VKPEQSVCALLGVMLDHYFALDDSALMVVAKHLVCVPMLRMFVLDALLVCELLDAMLVCCLAVVVGAQLAASVMGGVQQSAVRGPVVKGFWAWESGAGFPGVSESY